MLLEKIILYCDRVRGNLERYGFDFDAFRTDPMFQDACCMCVVQIGELASLLSEEVRRQNPAVPWRIIKDTRNFYVHAYGSIDPAAVWSTLTRDLPELKGNCQKILDPD